MILSIDEVDALLDCLPPPRKEEEGEDTEERQQIKTLNAGAAPVPPSHLRPASPRPAQMTRPPAIC